MLNGQTYTSLAESFGISEKDIDFIINYVLDRIGKITYAKMLEGIQVHFGDQIHPCHLFFTGIIIKELDYYNRINSINLN